MHTHVPSAQCLRTEKFRKLGGPCAFLAVRRRRHSSLSDHFCPQPAFLPPPFPHPADPRVRPLPALSPLPEEITPLRRCYPTCYESSVSHTALPAAPSAFETP